MPEGVMGKGMGTAVTNLNNSLLDCCWAPSPQKNVATQRKSQNLKSDGMEEGDGGWLFVTSQYGLECLECGQQDLCPVSGCPLHRFWEYLGTESDAPGVTHG